VHGHERLTKNQIVFREANELLLKTAVVSDGRRVPFLCECADDECFGRIELTTDEYWVAHPPDENGFVLLRGHLQVEDEVTVAEHDGHVVTRKLDNDS
jgi:hypothetical protein